MDNNVMMTGLLGTDPQLRVSRSGTPWVTFRLGSTPRVRREGEWVDDGTIWFTVHAWQRLAQNAATSLHKGDRVLVSGRLRVEQWIGDDGAPRETKIIEASALGPDLSFATAVVRRSAPGRERGTDAAQGQPVADVGGDDAAEEVAATG